MYKNDYEKLQAQTFLEKQFGFIPSKEIHRHDADKFKELFRIRE